MSLSTQTVPGGVVHELPGDLRVALLANAVALEAWRDITPLARNEFICWIEDAKQAATRSAGSDALRKSSRRGSDDPAAGPDVSIASATAGSRLSRSRNCAGRSSQRLGYQCRHG